MDPLSPLSSRSNSVNAEVPDSQVPSFITTDNTPDSGSIPNYGGTRARARSSDLRALGSSSRTSVLFNDSHLAENFVAALPRNVYQKLHRKSIISYPTSTRNSTSRFETLAEMRPFRLVGVSEPLCEWQDFRKDDQFLSSLKNKETRKFYEKQNDLIDRYSEIDHILETGFQIDMLREYGSDLREIHDNITHQSNQKLQPGPPSAADVTKKLVPRQGVPYKFDEESALLNTENSGKHKRLVMLAIYINFAVNVLLLIGKVIVALLTNSLTIIASLVDSVLDFLSTAIIWISSRLVGIRDWKAKHLYPVGRSRLEPIGVLVFSVLIIVSFFQVGNEAVQRLLWGAHDTVAIGLDSIAIMSLTVVLKLFCYMWCKTIESSSVEALAQDALTDVIFNTISIVMPFLGHYFDIWWIDPLVALCLACYISWTWGETALEHINNLTGAAADPEDQQVLLYLCARFADSIKQITALSAYHSGDKVTVEVDIVLDADSALRDCHDIGEALQYALETLSFVERAFVHLDYRAGNYAGHVIN